MPKLDLKKQFGARVRDLREQRDWTQDALADKIGRTLDTISNIERGVYGTRIGVAAKIATVFDISLSELFNWDDVPLEPLASERRRVVRSIMAQLAALDPKALAAVRDMIEASTAISKGRRTRSHS